jgi:hypothetical protein
MENNTKQIAAAFVKAQSQFGAALKTSTNPHFKSRYADLTSCIEAVIDALNSNGIALIQQTHEVESGICIETVFLHESGEELRSGKLWLPASKQDPQGYGSALTYARRYSLMASCGIAPEDDDGNAASKPQTVKALPDRVLADFIALIQSSIDMQELQTNFQNAYRAAQGANDQAAVETFTKLKDGIKVRFEKKDDLK